MSSKTENIPVFDIRPRENKLGSFNFGPYPVVGDTINLKKDSVGVLIDEEFPAVDEILPPLPAQINENRKIAGKRGKKIQNKEYESDNRRNVEAAFSGNETINGDISKSFEAALNSGNFEIELARAGGIFHDLRLKPKPRLKPLLSSKYIDTEESRKELYPAAGFKWRSSNIKSMPGVGYGAHINYETVLARIGNILPMHKAVNSKSETKIILAGAELNKELRSQSESGLDIDSIVEGILNIDINKPGVSVSDKITEKFAKEILGHEFMSARNANSGNKIHATGAMATNKATLIAETADVNKKVFNPGLIKPGPHPNFVNYGRKKSKKKKILWIILAIGILSFAGYYGLRLRGEIVNESNSGIELMENAKQRLKSFDFSGAALDFKKAYEQFTKAGDSLNFLGSDLGSILADISGNEKIKSASDLIRAGKLLANAGFSLSDAVSTISKSGNILNKNSEDDDSGFLTEKLKETLTSSKENIEKASELINSVDIESLPEDKRPALIELKNRMPEFLELMDESINYADFLENLVAVDGSKKYLLLFQNTSELRPTGGFPGTYGVITFKNGKLEDFFVDDVYNLDGQIKENIIPPRQLQHITPNWGMRDAAWFSDFPTSAKKVAEFFAKESGYGVDGVISVTPAVVTDLLRILGSIEMSKYNLTLNEDNFLAEIQNVVEYGENRKQPKTVVMDFAPEILVSLYSAEPSKWAEIYKSLASKMESGDILMYFKEKKVQKFAVEKGFAGDIKKTEGDYLHVSFSNVKGSKTDVVTDNSIGLVLDKKDNGFIHKLTITRKHNGGESEYGFYNKQNPAYVKVLVPKGAKLISSKGNFPVNFRPIMNYSLVGDFVSDEDLKNFESSFKYGYDSGIDKFEESGYDGFGFWMITDPGQTRSVELEYSVEDIIKENRYGLYFQKQPGTDTDNFNLSIDLNGAEMIGTNSALSLVGDQYVYNGKINKSEYFQIELK